MIEAVKGNVLESFFINPYGIIFLLLGLFFVSGYLYDRITGAGTFKLFCQKASRLLANKYILLLVIILTILNWIWNIHKGM